MFTLYDTAGGYFLDGKKGYVVTPAFVMDSPVRIGARGLGVGTGEGPELTMDDTVGREKTEKSEKSEV